MLRLHLNKLFLVVYMFISTVKMVRTYIATTSSFSQNWCLVRSPKICHIYTSFQKQYEFIGILFSNPQYTPHVSLGYFDNFTLPLSISISPSLSLCVTTTVHLGYLFFCCCNLCFFQICCAFVFSLKIYVFQNKVGHCIEDLTCVSGPLMS